MASKTKKIITASSRLMRSNSSLIILPTFRSHPIFSSSFFMLSHNLGNIEWV